MVGSVRTGVLAAAAGGALLGGRSAWVRSRRNENMDIEDRLAYSTMWGLTGAGVVAGTAFTAMKYPSVLRGLYRGGAAAATGAYKVATYHPLRGFANRATAAVESGTSSWLQRRAVGAGIGQGFKAYKGNAGAIGLLATLVAGVGAMAYGARKNPRTRAAASRNEVGDTEYATPSSVRERMGMMGAAGDMVFGLNNSRHG